jgi:hypothetical protein
LASATVNNFSARELRGPHEMPAGKTKDHPMRVVCPDAKKPSGVRFCWRRSFGRGFGFSACFLALQISIPPFSFLSFIVLLAHITLYIRDAFRLFGVL